MDESLNALPSSLWSSVFGQGASRRTHLRSCPHEKRCQQQCGWQPQRHLQGCPHQQSQCMHGSKHYKTSQAEKATRDVLKSAFHQNVENVETSAMLILDSLNYIKGFWYKIFCISKAADWKHGVVWVLNESKSSLSG